MTRILVQEDPNHPDGGFARVLVEGMAGRTITAVVMSREGFGADSLGPGGWQVAAAKLRPEAVFDLGGHLVLILGPNVVEHLEAGPIRLGLPEIDLVQVVMWPDIAPLPAARRGGFAPAQREARVAAPTQAWRGPSGGSEQDVDATIAGLPLPSMAPVVAAAPVLPAAPLVTVATPPRHGPAAPASLARRRAPIYALAVLPLAVLGVGGWFFQEQITALFDRTSKHVDSVVVITPPPDLIGTASPAQIAAMNLPAAQILAEAERRQARGQHQDALLLLEVSVGQNHPQSISALARLYDPLTFTSGGALSVPNAAKAAQLWRAAVLAGDPAAAPARAALRDRLAAAAQSGDTSAALALQDYWP